MDAVTIIEPPSNEDIQNTLEDIVFENEETEVLTKEKFQEFIDFVNEWYVKTKDVISETDPIGQLIIDRWNEKLNALKLENIDFQTLDVLTTDFYLYVVNLHNDMQIKKDGGEIWKDGVPIDNAREWHTHILNIYEDNLRILSGNGQIQSGLKTRIDELNSMLVENKSVEWSNISSIFYDVLARSLDLGLVTT